MEVVSVVLLLLFAVVISGAIARILPINLPAPLVQIAFGAAIGMAADLRVTLDPEIFLLVFLPPLLFIDGWRIPKDELLKDVPVVVELALGLVLTTVVGIGFFIDWLIPAMPLAVSFALAAVEEREEGLLQLQRRARGRLGMQPQPRDAQWPGRTVARVGERQQRVVAGEEAHVQPWQPRVFLRAEQAGLAQGRPQRVAEAARQRRQHPRLRRCQPQ